jgi:cytochrome c553/cytochrome c5
MKRLAWRAALLVAALGVGGLLVAASGIVSVKASSGHLAITEWMLQFGKRRSVATHTLGVDAPAMDEPWLVLKGAGHYETGCRPCHGAPDLERQPRIARAMTPPPPRLAPRIAEWEPEELFYIVKHGIKLTGMPAWPSQQRDDEVRAMVAFLLVLPDLDAAGYRRLVHAETGEDGAAPPLLDLVTSARPPAAVTASCARCHGVDGRGRGDAAFPSLAGQRREYLVAALEAFANDERHSGVMQSAAAALSSSEMRQLADYYSRLPLHPSRANDPRANAAAIERGREIARRGIPDQRVPSCSECHGPAPRRRRPEYPALAGQYAGYLVLQLQLFKSGRRGGSSHAHLMEPVVAFLRADQMLDVALYYAALPPPTVDR